MLGSFICMLGTLVDRGMKVICYDDKAQDFFDLNGVGTASFINIFYTFPKENM